MTEQFIEPTVGRVVHYIPADHERHDLGATSQRALAAMIVQVHDERLVNLTVFDGNGRSHGRTSVRLVQPGDAEPAGGYCRWMAYQLGQAERTREAEQAADDASQTPGDPRA